MAPQFMLLDRNGDTLYLGQFFTRLARADEGLCYEEATNNSGKIEVSGEKSGLEGSC